MKFNFGVFFSKVCRYKFHANQRRITGTLHEDQYTFLIVSGSDFLRMRNIRRAQVKVGLINLCKGLFSLNARMYYKLKSGT